MLTYLHLCAHFFQLGKFIEGLNEQLIKKGQEVNEYKEKYNIKIQGQEDHTSGDSEGDKKPRAGNVLVVNPM